MKTIVNKARKPLRLTLPGGKVLHLGPDKTGQLADKALDHPSVRKLLESGEIEIVGEGGPDLGGREPGVVHESTHGRTKVMPRTRGDR